MKALAAVLIAAMLVGCATAPTVAPLPANALFKPQLLTPTSSSASIQTGFVQTLADCQGVLYGFEQQSNNLKWWSVAIQLAGGIVGAIILPAAVVAGTAKSTVAALGGFSGFTNTAISTVRNEGLGAADIIRERASVQAAMQTALTKYYVAIGTEPMSKPQAIAAIDELKVACVSYWLASPTAQPIVVQ